jgi:predicted SprT family Zn-dependent metalloprotease
MLTISYITKNTIESIIRHTCDLNGASELAEKISFEFNNKLTSTWGRALLVRMKIELSALLWLARPDARHDTVVHEVCHIIAWHKYKAEGHGKIWKYCMRRAYMKPKATASGHMVI